MSSAFAARISALWLRTASAAPISAACFRSALAVAEHNIAVINLMSETYSNAQLNSPQQYLEFRIRGQYVSTVAAANPYQPLFTGAIADADLMITAFKNWGQAGKFGYTDFDVAQVWTTRDIAQQSPAGSGNYVYGVVGIAALSATCTANRYQILEDKAGLSGELLGSLATHETGHNLGAGHDATGNYVMSPSLASPPNLVFSSQSLTQISNYINGPGGACFSACNTAVPNTVFNISVNNLCTGDAVTFTDQSTGMVTSRSWSFPGGSPSSSTAAVQTVTYATAGVKTITLTTSNSFGSSSVSKTLFVGSPAIAGCRTTIAGSGEQGALPAFYLDDIKYEGNLYIDGHYEDLGCSQKTRLMPGTTYTGIAEMGFQFLPEYDVFSQLEIFIDYNNDGDFLDAGEGVYFSDNCSQGPVSFNFTTPTFVPVINTWLRMRAIGRPCSLPPTNGCAIPDNAQTRDFMVYLASAQPCIKYVNAAATGLNNGTSWANAFTDLQAALALPVNCDNNQVWVAAGTYKPTSTTSRTISFALKNNLSIYGGFPASGTPGFADRNPIMHETILSGDIGAATNTDNSYHVVKNIIALDATAVLDGFVITGGYANGGSIDNSGAGILNDPSNGIVCTPSIKNCILRNNTSSMNGGAVYNGATSAGANASPVFSNCVFLNNISINGAGAAVANTALGTGICNPLFVNCSFTGNEAVDAKVMFNQGGVCQPSIRNSIVFNNGGSNSFQNTNATLLVSSSYIEAGIGNYTSGAGNIISAVSAFVAAGSFQLSDTSAAINAGIQPGAPATDITGAARSGITDMGALENDQACYGADKIYYSNISGTAYQWQRDNGTGYANISSGSFYRNATSNVLTVIAPARTGTGQKFRCRVTTASGTVYSNEFTVRYFNHWIGTANTNWQNIQNWSCEEVPDQYTDVILKGGKNNYPAQNVNGAVRTLKAESGSTIRLTTGNNLQIQGLE
ncbi:MAG: hypothetical protein EOP51_14400 [Sphingobacteriales bacterium]|nr:MAG: hypothetical protein EOP51_14400 [Sphingobacteriales bacterium]